MENRSFLFEVGWKVDFVKGLERYSVYLDPRSKLKVNNKKKKVKKLEVGDRVGELEIKKIQKPLTPDHLLGIKKLKKVILINLNQFDNYIETPKVFSDEEILNILKRSSFEFARQTYDGLELFANDGQRIYLPFSSSNIPANAIAYEERTTKGSMELEIY